MNVRPSAPAAERNSAAILGVLGVELSASRDVLEIGSGTGQHAVYCAAALPHLTWQPSDLRDNHDGIRAWIAGASIANVVDPLDIDVRHAVAQPSQFDAVFSANTAHIMGMEAVESMFTYVGTTLRDDGLFILYGPFRQNGRFNTDSNAVFHQSLRSRDPGMGIRHLEDLGRFARRAGLVRERIYTMPANNHIVLWRRSARGRAA